MTSSLSRSRARPRALRGAFLRHRGWLPFHTRDISTVTGNRLSADPNEGRGEVGRAQTSDLPITLAEGLAEERHGEIGNARYRIRAFAASADNIGLFFGEDVFVAFGVVLFMENFLRGAGIEVSPLRIAVAGIPTAVLVFFFHSFRLYRLDSWLSSRNSHQLETSGSSSSDTGVPAQKLGDHRS
jgi:hypothetical protein